MTGLRALLGKELLEQLRTYRLLIVSAAFLFFGLSTPLLLKYLPEIIKLSGDQVPVGLLPPPTAIQSLTEYSGTIVQIGVLITVLIAMGAIAREREKGTAAMTLSKPVTRAAFVVSKMLALSTTLLAAIVLGAIACYVYTVLLIEPASLPAFIGLNLLLAIFLALCLAVTLLCSCLFKAQLAAGGVALVSLIGQGVLANVPVIGDYMPGRLITWGTALVNGQATTGWVALIITLVLIALSLYLARLSLSKAEL